MKIQRHDNINTNVTSTPMWMLFSLMVAEKVSPVAAGAAIIAVSSDNTIASDSLFKLLPKQHDFVSLKHSAAVFGASRGDFKRRVQDVMGRL
ncbi:MAG: hypothetical protein AB1476_03250 [Candidatus Hadarchaeota archaeon]